MHRYSRRNTAGASSIANQLIAKYGRSPEFDRDGQFEIPAPPLPLQGDIRGMGPLVWLEMQPFKGKWEYWDFAKKNGPHLGYDISTSQLWPVGGCYQIDARGFHNSNACGSLVELSVDEQRKLSRNRKAIDDFEHNHGARPLTLAVQGKIILPTHIVTVGKCRAITYFTDKGNGKGFNNYRHVFADRHPRGERFEHMPFVDVAADGRSFVLRGGTYELADGWIDD